MAAAGAGGIEFLPFYLYGLPQIDNPIPPTDWAQFGFGTPAFNRIFKSALIAANDSEVRLDFSMGASQGQGVPSKPVVPGLAVELVRLPLRHLEAHLLMITSEWVTPLLLLVNDFQDAFPNQHPLLRA